MNNRNKNIVLEKKSVKSCFQGDAKVMFNSYTALNTDMYFTPGRMLRTSWKIGLYMLNAVNYFRTYLLTNIFAKLKINRF